MTNSYQPQARAVDTFVQPSTVAPVDHSGGAFGQFVTLLAEVNPGLQSALAYRTQKAIEEEEAIGLEIERDEKVGELQPEFKKYVAGVRKKEGDEAATQLIGGSIFSDRAYRKARTQTIVNNAEEQVKALYQSKTYTDTKDIGEEGETPISHFSIKSPQFQEFLGEAGLIGDAESQRMGATNRKLFLGAQGTIIENISTAHIKNHNEYKVDKHKGEFSTSLLSNWAQYQKGNQALALNNIQDYIEDTVNIGLSEAVTADVIIETAKNQASRIYEINEKAGAGRGYNAVMEYLDMVGQLKHGPKEKQKDGTYKQRLIRDSYAEDILKLRVKLGEQDDKIRKKLIEQVQAKEEKAIEDAVKEFSSDNKALENLLEKYPNRREFLFDQIEIYSDNRDDLFDDFNYKVGVGYYANNRTQMFVDLALIKEQIGETFTEEDRDNYNRSFEIARRSTSSNVGKFDARLQRTFKEGRRELGGTGFDLSEFLGENATKGSQHWELQERINRRVIDEIQNVPGLSDQEKENIFREIQADYVASVKIIKKGGDYEETGIFDSAETKERKAGIQAIQDDYGMGLEDATLIYDQEFVETVFEAGEGEQQGQENKPGDWYRDKTGQIYIFQDFGKWTRSNRKGSGKEVTKPGGEKIEEEEKEKEDTGEKNYIQLLIDGLKGKNRDELVSELNAAKENLGESETGLVDSILNTFMGSAAAEEFPKDSVLDEIDITKPIAQPNLEKLALEGGFTPEQAKIMAAIAMAESGGDASIDTVKSGLDPDKRNEFSIGLWQINMIEEYGVERRNLLGIDRDEQLYDPATNVRAAKMIFDQQGFEAWGAYTNGSYKKFLPKLK